MRILHISETTKGGVASYLTESLPAQIAQFGEGQIGILLPNSHQEFLPQTAGLQVFTFARQQRGLLASLRLVVASFKAVKNLRPKIVFLHSTFAGVLVRTMLLLHPNRPKIVYCAHGWAFNMCVPNWQKKLYTLLERTLANWATDKIICISQYEKESALKAGLPASKLKLIYNGIAINKQSSKPLSNSSKVINILYVGRLDRQKGIDILLKALENIPQKQWHLTIVGAAVSSDCTLKIPSTVTQINWLKREKLAKYYAMADVLVVPSRWEGFGLVALEGMANSTAVFATKVDGLAEVIEDGVNGKVFPLEDSKALGNLLLNTNKIKLHKMGRAGYKIVKEKFSATKMNQKTNKLLTEL